MKIYNGMMRKEQIIYMRIKRNLLIGFCSMLLFNCSRETYVGELSTDDDAPLVEPVPILLSLGMSDFQILTRGSGEVNNGNGAKFWDDVRFYVYAFNQDPETDLSKPWSEANEDNCLLDGHRGGRENAQNSDHGKEVGVKKEDSNLMLFYPDDDSQKIYYNMKNTNLPYNFFAYYLDDCKRNEFHREKDHIYYDVEIDGRNDLMSAWANPEVQKDKYEGNPYRDKILDRAFSAYSANHGLNPVFQLQHHLVLLRFVICKPNLPSDGYGTVIPELNSDLRVNKIEIKSKYEGRFTVAVSDPKTSDETKPKRGISFDVEDQKYFELKKKNGEPLGADGYWRVVAECPRYKEITKEDKKFNRYLLGKDNEEDGGDSGTSLLVAPADSYWARISLSVEEEGLNESLYNTVDVELKYDKGKDVFKAGNAYTIYLTINSLSDIESKVESGIWADGGDINISPDDEYKDE
ncbi:hypothetical protein [Bacteroides congonensis]